MKKTAYPIVMIVLWLHTVPALGADTVDHSLWAELLEAHVKLGVVDYKGFQKDEKKLDQYLEALENVSPDTLDRDAQFAYYINLYNAWTVKLILTEYPDIESIKDIGGFFSSPWKKKIVRVKGGVLTLDNVEHDILRPQFKDPRVHFAVNCASRGCPPLRSEPYRGPDLDRQLDDATAGFINDPQRNYLKGNALYVSRIFKWFKEDFNDDIAGFIIQYADPPLKAALEAGAGRIEIEYLDYDWGLNGS